MKNLNEIKNILCDSKASDFSILAADTNSYELFFVHGKLETVRKSTHAAAQVGVFVDHDGKRGNANFGIGENADREEIIRKTEEAVKRAQMIYDAPYTLPSDGQNINAVIPSNIADKDEKQIGAEVANAVFAACTKKDCDINALEIFVTEKTSTVLNSKGLNKKQTKYTISVEAIPTCNGRQESVELFETYTFGELDTDAIMREIAARTEDVSARSDAVKPDKQIDCPVILNAYELQTLFEEIVGDANFAREYLHTNLHSVGDKWQTAPNGDKLNVTMRGVIKGSPDSALFDGDGTTLKDVKIIENGKIIAGYGGNRFAQYLGKEPTGALGCMDVECGNTPVSELLSSPYLECVYLSGLQVDLYNDYIGGEIRLAYYFDGKTRIPVTGIAMSGKLSEVLNNLTLSRERTVLGAYSGPEKIKLSGFKIF